MWKISVSETLNSGPNSKSCYTLQTLFADSIE